MSAAARPALRLASAVAAADLRPDLVRLCAGEPVALDRVDLIAFANAADAGLDPDVDPDDYALAEIALDLFHLHVGTNRRTGGGRAADIAGDLTRYVLPFAVELAAARPLGRRGIAHLRVQHAEELQTILSGDQALPAATVAADRLKGRLAVTCLWLTTADAARVCTDGEPALAQALADGRLTTRADRYGQRLVFAADLRAADLLEEPDRPHGLAASTASNIVTLLRLAIGRGRDLGAHVRGSFTTLKAVEPLESRRQRPVNSGPRPYVALAEIARRCTVLTPTHQLAVWLMRLVGLRIAEAYGLLVSDFSHDGTRAWLRVETQGGQLCWVRNALGRLVAADTKAHTKTAGSTRTVPICRQLADLISEVIRVFHTDPATGQVYTGARLIPGLRSEDASGIHALRASMQAGFRHDPAAGPAVAFEPHDLRRAFITDLTNAGVDERAAEWYTGHAAPKTVHAGYDLGPFPAQLEPVADLVGALVAGERSDLRVPTTKMEQWGRSTRRGRDRDRLRAELRETGWLISRSAQMPPDAVCAPPQEGADAGDVDATELARRAGVSPGSARRWMRDGELPAQEVTWGDRTIWTARATDVDRLMAARTGATVHDMALELGWTYTQTWALLVALRLTTGHRSGTAIRLGPADVTAIRAEVARRAEAGAQVLLVADAAQRLSLPDDSIGTLVRQGRLLRAPAPDNTRHRYLTLASVDAFAAAHPVGTTVGPGDLVVPVAAVRRILGVTRPMMTHLVSTRQLCATTAGRKQTITMTSLQAWLTSHPIDGAQAALKEAAMALPTRT
jgi:integrase